MSILQKQKSRDPSLGYATDFVKLIGKIVSRCQEKNIKIIANAGGVNTAACLQAIVAAIKEAGVSGVNVAVVEGDDIYDRLDQLIAAGESFNNIDTGAGIEGIRDNISSANAYLGAAPIVEALQQGADIVVTGRGSDPSVVLAPLVYEFGWSMQDYDKLAAGTIMGHIIECGTQSTGGNYSRWQEVPDFARIGFPIAEAQADGSFVVTKHDNTGGLVNVETVSSQLLYEIGDPENYLGPDCISDFTSINIEQQGPDRVAISGIRGKAPTPTFKVSMSYSNGYKILSSLCVSGPDAVEKAELIAQMAFTRMEMHGAPIAEADRFVELFGTNVLYKGIVPAAKQPHEIMLRLGAKGKDPKILNLLGTEIAPLLTSGPPGITGFAGGRARATEVIGYWPTLVNKKHINTTITMAEA